MTRYRQDLLRVLRASPDSMSIHSRWRHRASL